MPLPSEDETAQMVYVDDDVYASVHHERRRSISQSLAKLMSAKNNAIREVASLAIASQIEVDWKMRQVFQDDNDLVNAVVYNLRAPEDEIRLNCVKSFASLARNKAVASAHAPKALPPLCTMLQERPGTAPAAVRAEAHAEPSAAAPAPASVQEQAALAISTALQFEAPQGALKPKHARRIIELIGSGTGAARISAVESVEEVARHLPMRKFMAQRTDAVDELVHMYGAAEDGSSASEQSFRALLRIGEDALPQIVEMLLGKMEESLSGEDFSVTMRLITRVAQLLPRLVREKPELAAQMASLQPAAFVCEKMLHAADRPQRVAAVQLLDLLGPRMLDKMARAPAITTVTKLLTDGWDTGASARVLAVLVDPIESAAPVLRAFVNATKPGVPISPGVRRAVVEVLLGAVRNEGDRACRAIATQPGLLTCIVASISARADVDTTSLALGLVQALGESDAQNIGEMLMLRSPPGGLLTPLVHLLEHFRGLRADTKFAYTPAVGADPRRLDDARGRHAKLEAHVAVTLQAVEMIEGAMGAMSEAQRMSICESLPPLLAELVYTPILAIQATGTRCLAALTALPGNLYHLLKEPKEEKKAKGLKGAKGAQKGAGPPEPKPGKVRIPGTIDSAGTVVALSALAEILCAAHGALIALRKRDLEEKAARIEEAKEKRRLARVRARAVALGLAPPAPVRASTAPAGALRTGRRPSVGSEQAGAGGAQQGESFSSKGGGRAGGARVTLTAEALEGLGSGAERAQAAVHTLGKKPKKARAPKPKAGRPGERGGARKGGKGGAPKPPADDLDGLPMLERRDSSSSIASTAVASVWGAVSEADSAARSEYEQEEEEQATPLHDPVIALGAEIGEPQNRLLALKVLEDACTAFNDVCRREIGRDFCALRLHLPHMLARVYMGEHSQRCREECAASLVNLAAVPSGHVRFAASSVLQGVTATMLREANEHQRERAIVLIRNLAKQSTRACEALASFPEVLKGLARQLLAPETTIMHAAVAAHALLLRAPAVASSVLEACGKEALEGLVVATESNKPAVRHDAVYSISRLLSGGGDERLRMPLAIQHGRTQTHLGAALLKTDVRGNKSVLQALQRLAEGVGLARHSPLVTGAVEALSELAVLHPVELDLVALDQAKQQKHGPRRKGRITTYSLKEISRKEEKGKVVGPAAASAAAASAPPGARAPPSSAASRKLSLVSEEDGGGGGASAGPEGSFGKRRSMRTAEPLRSSWGSVRSASRVAGSASVRSMSAESTRALGHASSDGMPRLFKAPRRETLAQSRGEYMRRVVCAEIALIVGKAPGGGPLKALLNTLDGDDDTTRVRAPHRPRHPRAARRAAPKRARAHPRTAAGSARPCVGVAAARRRPRRRTRR